MRELLQFSCRPVATPLLPLLFSAIAFAGQTATPVAEFAAATADPPLRLPTAVAIGPDDDVFVLDGVHNRILIFRPDGSIAGEVSTFGGEKLNQPVGLKVTPDGRLWVADSGNGRIVIGGADGSLDRRIDLPAPESGHPADPTDVAVTGDGAALWIADNDHHRLARFDLRAGTWQIVGRLGAALGQFEYPFAVAVAPSGDVVVTDVINARAQLLNAAGEPLRSMGAYGVELGQFHRPGGLAIDDVGQVWIADSVIGVIQVFRADGSLIDVVRDAAGGPLRLEGPLGMAFDRHGALYVVESRANRVRKFALEKTERAVPPPAAHARPAAVPGQQAKACTICHMEWEAPFADGRDSSLMPRPATSGDDPLVARSETCLSCHDGTVVDSRRRVWEEHGHRTGVTPPATITVPAHLPLINGQLACRTCHSAHGSDVPSGDFRRAVLLRVPNQASELCMSCHVDKTRGPRFGTHPTGGMPWPVPDALISAGAKVGPNPRELTCQVCHTPHGAKNDHLLVLGTSSNQLCVTCHDQIRPGMFRDGAHTEHPLTAIVNAEQAAAVHDLGTKLGPEGQLICLSCHKLHHGFGERFMLADELSNGQMCLRCHSQRREMVGSAHDLRTNFPVERNRLGLTATEGGPCSSCHLFHRYARATAPGPGDAAGHCLTCHQTGQCAQNKLLGDVNHPSVECTECHNPHETRFGDFLRARPESLCMGCHTDKSRILDGSHDATRAPGAWCPTDSHAGDRCLACHTPHAAGAAGLFRVEPASGQPPRDGVCLACHPSETPQSFSDTALLHPTAIDAKAALAQLPLIEQPGHAMGIGCVTCHDPHSGPEGSARLLRATRADGIDLCLQCHSQMESIVLTSHSPDSLATHRLSTAACGPCHNIHANPQTAAYLLLWSRDLLAPAPAQPGVDGALIVADAHCTGCHRPQGPAPAPQVAWHPAVALQQPPDTDGGPPLPLFDEGGVEDSGGRITCQTCHLPHGRSPQGGPSVLELEPAFGQTKPASLGLHLRPFSVPNVCTTCHGADALRRVLYFHDPLRRKGPIQ